MYKTLAIVWVILSMSVCLSALPESPHPYPDNFDDTQIFVKPGAIALEISFSGETFTEADRDFIIVTDGENRSLGEFSGSSLRGQKILVEGDSVRIRLVSDGVNSGYGYSVTDIRMVFSREYFQVYEIDYGKADMFSGQDLKEELYQSIKNHVSLGYTPARQKMFGEIDNESGSVRCVYTGRWVTTPEIPDPADMNTEHTWPKSKGAENEPARSDIYHLFPTDSYTNAKRANYPFGTVVIEEWSKGGSYLGLDSGSSRVFTPRADHRGNVARAMFYFSVRYRLPIPAYEEQVLRTWHLEDPTDATEQARNDDISRYQKNRNPFIDHPEYVDRIDDF